MLAWCFAEHSNVLVSGHWKQTNDVASRYFDEASDSLAVDVWISVGETSAIRKREMEIKAA